MFTELSQIIKNNQIGISVSQLNDKMTVIVIPAKGVDWMKPLVLTGTPEELDANFIEYIQKPIERVLNIHQNITEFEAAAQKELDDKKKAKEEKTAKVAEGKTGNVGEKAVKEKEVKFDDKATFKTANELFAKKQYNEALVLFNQCALAKPTHKPYTHAVKQCEMWLKATANLETAKEVVTASNPEQAELLNHPNVIFTTVEPHEEEEEIVTEGPGESEDNATESEEDFRL